MFERIVVLPRISERHPDVSEEDVLTAWRHAWAVRRRNFDMPSHYMAAGLDTKGRLIEMVGAEREDGTLVVYNAMKMTDKARRELGI